MIEQRFRRQLGGVLFGLLCQRRVGDRNDIEIKMSHDITHPFVLPGHSLSLTFNELALHVLALSG